MKKIYLYVGMLTLVVFMLVLASFGQFSLSGVNKVYVPDYMSFSCKPIGDGVSTLNSAINRRGEFFPCTTDFTGRYVPLNSNLNCKYYLDSNYDFSVYDCPLGVSEGDVKGDCDKLTGVFQDTKTFYSVSAGRQLWVDPFVIAWGTRYVNMESPDYGLSVESAQGYDYPSTDSCELSSFNGVPYHTVGAGSSLLVHPNSPLNAVTGLSPVITNQVGSWSDVANGDLVYIVAPGYYQKIKEADDGFLYVDTVGANAGWIADSDIECIPYTPLCGADAKIVSDVEDTPVNELGGAVSGYAPVQGDPSKLCKYDVVNGHLSVTNDCIAVIDCPQDLPFWNPQTGNCETLASDASSSAPGVNWLFILGVAVVFIFALLVMVIVKNKGGKK